MGPTVATQRVGDAGCAPAGGARAGWVGILYGGVADKEISEGLSRKDLLRAAGVLGA